MNLETIIADKVHNLPPVKQLKILTFIEDLAGEEDNKSQNSDNLDAATRSKRFSFIGIGESRDGDVSKRAEEILEHEIKRRIGWSLKDEIAD